MKAKYYRNGDICNVEVDASKADGLMRFSHEISLTFKQKDGEWKFSSAWHIGVCEVTYEENEEDLFEADFPGLLDEVRSGIS